MASEGEQQPKTPHHPAPPPIAAESKEMAEPVMVRTLTDTVQPTSQKVTAEIDADILMTESQRDINRMWEGTQKGIADWVTKASVSVASVLSLSPLVPGIDAAVVQIADKAFMFLVATTAGVIGYYFARTNTHRIGGVQKGDTGR